MAYFKINMEQMSKFVVNSDNIDMYDIICKTKGSFTTFYPDKYVDILNEFNIFFTMTQSESEFL